MATLKLIIDKRAEKKDKTYPIKISLAHKGKTVYISTDISVRAEQFDALGRITGHPNKSALNDFLQRRLLDIQTILLGLNRTMTAAEMKAIIEQKIDEGRSDKEEKEITFLSTFDEFIGMKSNRRTKEIYMVTRSAICRCDKNAETLLFTDITKRWLTDFDTFLSKSSPSQNARNIHMRNIRAVFNHAIDEGITKEYPFRKYKIKNVKTTKRSLSIEELRGLFSYNGSLAQQKYIDYFKLIFFLIGINIIDLCELRSIERGRIEYHRAKTKKLYSIKVEPEALDLIEKYRGENFLLQPLDAYKDYRNFAKKINECISGIAGYEGVTTYWARHSWATIAASLDIPKETIAAALGHELGNRVTSIYIDFDQKKVDEANRRVIDYVLYDKR